MKSPKETTKLLAINAILLGLLLCAIEAGATLFVAAADRVAPSGRLLDLARSIYWRHVTELGFSPECGEYNEHLAYTLRPGGCTFKTPAFTTTLKVNRLGLRDDERSLVGPRIIVLGDSQAMGWGVEQDRTFAQIIEDRVGYPVLDAAVPSFGTVREMINLGRLQTDRLELLIVQYCDNDFEENQAFRKNAETLPIMSRERYLEVAESDRQSKAYYFGRNTIRLVRHLIQDLAWHPAPGARTREAPELFLNALTHSPVNLHGVPIVVLELNTGYEGNDQFIPMLEEMLAKEPERAGGLTITTLDLKSQLGPDDYLRLDGHLNERGHRIVADAILQRLPALRRPPGAQKQ